MQKSIEVEYWVIDETGALTETGELTETSEFTVPEFVDCMFELKTPPCETVDELRETFVEQLDETLSLADELDKHLVPLATPLNCESIERRSSDRGDIQKSAVGSNFGYAKHCAGTHFHFEQRNVIDQLNTLLALDPALALCNSSPYYQGHQIASSARAHLYRKMCYEQLPRHGQLWDYAETVAQWKRRLDRCFEEFQEAATQNGQSVDQIDAHFSPDDVVWTPVRLRDSMPTVEWRSPDTTLPSEIFRLLEGVDDVMEQIHHKNVRIGTKRGSVDDDEFVLPEFDVLRDLADAAIHSGLESPAVTNHLSRMGFAVEEYSPLTREFENFGYIPCDKARSLRLQYAERLVEDVDRLQNAGENSISRKRMIPGM